MSQPVEPAGEARWHRIAWLGLVILALLPSLGTLAAPWIAEDAAILAKVHEEGPWADWTRSQYGLLLVRFWRPVVSTSWGLQEALTSIAPEPLRAVNWMLHAAVAWLVFRIALRLGAGLPGAVLGGAWIALFPEQGGTSTWLAGRTDLFGAVFLLGAVWVALGRFPRLAMSLAFLAAASKEFGFLAPLWIAILSRGRGDGWREAGQRTLPALLAVAAAFLWRRLALGTFAGGYAGELPDLFDGLLAAGRAAGLALWPSGVLLAALLLVGAWARACQWRGFLAALLAAGLAAGLLYPLLAGGHLEPENRRLLYVPECGLALGVALAWARLRPGKAPAFALLALTGLGWRGTQAWSDTHAWARSARVGEEAVARARRAVENDEPSQRPVLFQGFPPSHEGAYCLGFGLAARFRAPFPPSPSPVWPWRLLFVQDPRRERQPVSGPESDGSIRPWGGPFPLTRLAMELPHESPNGGLVLDERVLMGDSERIPRLEASGGPPGAPVEAVLFTELGYEPVPLGVLDGEGAFGLSLRELLSASNGVVAAGQVLQQAADVGARVAWLELRVLGPDGRPMAASEWIEIAWPVGFLARSLSGP